VRDYSIFSASYEQISLDVSVSKLKFGGHNSCYTNKLAENLNYKKITEEILGMQPKIH
jgi:hypothetical protein